MDHTIPKRIIVGVSGGNAAYKACELIRLLTKSGHEVKVILTENAKKFVHKNTFLALTHHHAYDDLLKLTKTSDMLMSIMQLNPRLFKVGFCAETTNLVEQAQQKLQRKHLQAIVANQITLDGYPFNSETNTLTYINNQQETYQLEKETKTTLAKKLLTLIATDYQRERSSDR